MEEQAAKFVKEAAEERLLMRLDTIKALINGPAERRPMKKLRRELAATQAMWEGFNNVHISYMEGLQLEQSKVIEREAFKKHHESAQGIFAQMEDLLHAFGPAALPPRQQIDDDILYGIAREEQVSFFGHVKNKVDSVEACLESAVERVQAQKKCRQELEQLNKELDRAVEHMKAAAVLTKEMNRLKPDEAEEDIRQEADTAKELRRKIDKQRRVIARKLATVAVPEAAGGNGGNRMGNDAFMYQRRPLPKFDGQKRNYPAFKREWQAGITGRFDAEFEVREIKFNVPAEVEPDIKNLTTMAKVWRVLDSRYGKVMELTKELMSDLQCFVFSEQATSNSAKFMELQNEFVKVYNDLKQIDRLSVLDHEPTLCTLAKQLPGDDSKMRYTKLRLRRLEENEEAVRQAAEGAEPVKVLSNLDIMNEFMRKEREIQVSFGQLLSTETSRSKTTDSSRTVDMVPSRGGGGERRCYRCDMHDHKARDCPSQFGRGGGWRIAYHCYRCNVEGHETSECKGLRVQRRNRTNRKISFNASMPDNEMVSGSLLRGRGGPLTKAMKTSLGRNHHQATNRFSNFVKKEAGKPRADTNRPIKVCNTLNKVRRLTSFKNSECKEVGTSHEEVRFKDVNKVQESGAKQGEANQKFWRPWEEAECKEVMVVEAEKAARSEYEEVVKSKVKIQETISKDPIKKVMERVNKEEEMSFLFEESERESVEVRKKAEVETLNIKNRQRGLLKGKESHGNVIKCEERVFKADPVPPQLPCHLQAVPATGAVAGREAEKWRVVRRRRATRW